MVEGQCPKCGKPGRQRIHQDGKSSRFYLEYIHYEDSRMRVCHIGRVRSTSEAMSEFEESTEQQYKEALDGIVKDIKELVNSYEPESRIWQKVLAKRLNEIFNKYGY